MVAQRRFGPLIGAVGAGLVVLCVRLFQVQIVEHEVWAQQAAGLVRSSRVLPSHRGSILDRKGQLLVHDEDAYRVDFRYREFRRRHPLGVLVHAFSSLEMRAVPVVEAWANRAAWADALIGLSPCDLDGYEQGGALALPFATIPSSSVPGTELRGRRAADVRYYAGQLLGLTSKEANWLRNLEPAERGASFVTAIAGKRGLEPQALRERVLGSVEAACAELVRLAPYLETHPDRAASGDSMEHLLAFLDEARADIEDETANELFVAAAGFDPGVMPTAVLANAFDVDWIGRLQRWDGQRLSRWIATRADSYRARVENLLLPRALVHVELESQPRRAERLLDELAYVFVPERERERDDEGRPPSWRDLDDLALFDELRTLCAGVHLSRDDSGPGAVLPLLDPDLRKLVPDAADPWKTVGLLSEALAQTEAEDQAPLHGAAAVESWTRWGRDRAGLEGEPAQQELTRLFRALDRRHRTASASVFQAAWSSLAHGDGPLPRLAFTESRRKRAEARDRFVQVDRGNRPVRVLEEPDYALVERIARHPDLYRGFEVRESTRRVQVARGVDGEVCAGLLIGAVGKPPLRELLKQREDEARLADLRFMVVRNDDEEREMRALAARVQRADEWSGASGLEDYLDPDLRGKPGWLQTEGLEERSRDDGPAVVEAPRDGQDVVLTLDADVQNAAQHVISHPRMPSERTDRVWFENPVGAIVLLTPDGDVLAAASAPNESGYPPIPGRDQERAVRRERTLQRPTFNPPGSVFKPFVAAYALEKLGFDPHRQFECRDLGKGRGGFESMHCTGIHGTSDLERALTVSCNSYFAQLGLEYGVDDVLAMADLFGFTSETGIKNLGTQGRSGLREDIWSATELRNEFGSRGSHLQFGNGLKVIQLVPMQVARATCGLVTGTLPDLRLVRTVGGEPTPHPAHELPIHAEVLNLVRGAMRKVVESPEGSAYGRGLDAATLGFTFACKTGSADYAAFRESPDLDSGDQRAHDAGKVRKHTWITGFFPVESPKAVLVVYLHDVSETSSHTAVYVAAQFLQSEAVKRFVAEACAGDKQ